MSNKMCDLSHYVDFDPLAECGIKERVRFDVLQELLGQYSGEELKDQIRLHRADLVPKHIIIDDILTSINYMNGLARGISVKDDIDHLGNRRLRCVGELLQNQFRIGFSRMERVIRERMTIQDLDVVTPRASSTSAPSLPPSRSSSAPAPEPVHGSDQPPGGADPQAASFRPGPRRPLPRACQHGGPRRPLQPLRPHVPHRDP